MSSDVVHKVKFWLSLSDEIVAGNSGDTRVVIGNQCTDIKYFLHILAAVLYWS